jgi:hypothetical protein
MNKIILISKKARKKLRLARYPALAAPYLGLAVPPCALPPRARRVLFLLVRALALSPPLVLLISGGGSCSPGGGRDSWQSWLLPSTSTSPWRPPLPPRWLGSRPSRRHRRCRWCGWCRSRCSGNAGQLEMRWPSGTPVEWASPPSSPRPDVRRVRMDLGHGERTTYFWVPSLLVCKIGSYFAYSVGGIFSTAHHAF